MSHSADPRSAAPTDPPLSEWEQDWQASNAASRILRQRRPLARSVWRGLTLRCPHCAAPGLIRHPDPPGNTGMISRVSGWLARWVAAQPVESCPQCGEPYGHIRTDDFAPWLSILLLGHILLPAVITVERVWHPPLWVQFPLWMLIAVEFIRATLPRAKGAALGLMWALGLRGDEQR